MDKSSTRGRDLVIAVGGPLQAGENRKAWVSRVAASIGVSYRVARAAFHDEQCSDETKQKLKRKAGLHESAALAVRLDYLVQSLALRKDCDLETLDALRGASHKLRLLGGPGSDASLILGIFVALKLFY